MKEEKVTHHQGKTQVTEVEHKAAQIPGTIIRVRSPYCTYLPHEVSKTNERGGSQQRKETIQKN
jgi:hypothetical protein